MKYRAMVNTRPEITVPHNESSGFFMINCPFNEREKMYSGYYFTKLVRFNYIIFACLRQQKS